MNRERNTELKRTKGDNKNTLMLSISNLQNNYSNFQNFRKKWDPCLPLILRSPVKIREVSNFEDINEIQRVDVSSFFPLTFNSPLVKFEAVSDGSKSWNKYPARRIGVVLSGGQAPGGHNVIAGVMSYIKLCNQSSQLFGFLGGPEGVYTGKYIELSEENIEGIFNQGGFNIICSGRHKIETEEQMKASMVICEKLNLHGLLVIGGDDSNTNAAILAEYFKKNHSSTIVIGCPKTIDGDLKNDIIETSFGYDTAIKTYSEEIGSMLNCLLTEKNRYYFVRLMGRSASHIALECGLQTHCNLILVGEEIKKENRSLMSIVDEIVEMIISRDSIGKRYGIVLLPEGLIEFIPEFEVLIKELNLILLKLNDREKIIENLTFEMKNLFLELPIDVQNQLLLERDPHGNVQVAKIATEKLLVFMAKQKLERMNKSYILDNVKTHYLGYEGRCALPSNFDANYCFALGHTAAALIDNKCSGYMAIIRKLAENPRQWEPIGCPLTYMMNIEFRKGESVPVIKKYLVDLNGHMYKAYCKVRSEWKLKDYYRNPGPIQFEGPNSNITNYMISPPKIEDLLNNKQFSEDNNEISNLRSREEIKVPKVLLSKTTKFYGDNEIYSCNSQELSNIVARSLPHQVGKHKGKVLLLCEEDVYSEKNCKYNSVSTKIFSGESIGVILSNSFVSGSQNVILGLISSLKCLKQLIVFRTITDFMSGKATVIDITSENVVLNLESFLNSGGIRLPEVESKLQKIFEKKTSVITKNNEYSEISEECIRSCKSLIDNDELTKLINLFNLSAIVLMGDDDTVTFGSQLSEQLLCIAFNNMIVKEIPVVVIPVCIENSITHPMIDLCLGFDTITHNISTLVGNLLTDSASATKYWYFMKLIGSKTSNIALEVSLQTHPNMVIIPERYKENYSKVSNSDLFDVTLDDIITEICDIICLRSNQGKNFGGLIISEGLLDQIYPTNEFRKLIFKYTSKGLIDFHSKLNDIEKMDIFNKFEKKVIEDFKLIFNDLDEKIIRNLGHGKMDEILTEVIISSLVQKELKYRKTQNKFKGGINSICFDFNDQIKSCFPSELDCNLGYMYGKIAGKIIQNNLIGGFVTGIKGILEQTEEWKFYAIPISNLMTLDFFNKNNLNIVKDEFILKKETKTQKIIESNSNQRLICKLNSIDFQNNVSFQLLMSNVGQWELKNVYTNPGPIQFFGNFKNIINRTLFEEQYTYTRNLKEINEILTSIKHSCHFGVNKEILDTTVCHLRALKRSISILDKSSSKEEEYENFAFLKKKDFSEIECCEFKSKFEDIELLKSNVIEERCN